VAKKRRRYVEHIDDERELGHGVIVTLQPGWSFDPSSHEGVRGFDTLAEAKAGAQRKNIYECPVGCEECPTPPKKRRRRRPNPTVLILGNPPVAGELFGDEVTKLEYHHIEDGDDVVRVHDFGKGVRIYALEDGNVLLVHARKDRPLWAHH